MEWYEIKATNNRTVNFAERSKPGNKEVPSKQNNELDIGSDYIGGIINRGNWGWMSRRDVDTASITIYQLSNGYPIASYTFLSEQNLKCSISCVEELTVPGLGNRVLLAVCIEVLQGGTQLALFSPTNSQVLRYIDLNNAEINVTCMAFLDEHICAKSKFHQFDGCLAMGTTAGNVHLMDVNASQIVAKMGVNLCLYDNEVEHRDIHCIKSLSQLDQNLIRCRQEDIHLAFDVKIPTLTPSPISKLMPMKLVYGFVAGMQDGRVCVYDLRSMQPVAQIRRPDEHLPSPVVGLCYIVPPDDPQPCYYICAVYDQGDELISAMHSFNYRRPSPVSLDNGEFALRDFQAATTRIRISLDTESCSFIGCTTASTFASGEHGTVLTAITWRSQMDNRIKLVIFDINQWYKEEMPTHPNPQEDLNYLCGFILSGQHVGLALQLDTDSIIPFISLQCHDAYYFPKALSFDCMLMTIKGCQQFEYMGVQRSFLNSLYYNKANIFLNPEAYVRDIVRLRMLPQFHNVEPHWSLSKLEMYELIMSMGLEQDRMWLLKSCARSCLDGSLLCNMMSSTKLSLSVITNWIVRRARHIKQRCADLCEGIFDCGAYALEERERKEMQHLNNQLLRLSEVQHLLVKLTKARLNLELVDDLEFTQNTLKVLYDYQRILHWLIESGILPESSQEQQQSMPSIRRDYDKRRAQLKRSAKHNAKLYVDELMHQYGFQAELKKLNEDRLYPPQSLQTLMRLMLLQDFNLEQKHELMLYLILDLDQFYKSGEHELYKDFAESFGLAEPFVKCVRSFWFLDKGDHETALDILYRGRTGRGVYTEWQTKHLIETLLHYNANAEALQVVNMPPGYVSSELKLQVLLANNNIPEAFHHARFCMDKDGRPLLEHFFQHCIVEGKFNVLATLCLRDNEEQLVYRQLRQCKTRAADCIQLILLLKRCKYIEAVSFMDEVAAERELSDETSGILTAYRTTMAPVTQSIAGSYFRVRNRLNGNHFTNFSPEPFSCQLAKQLANGHMGDIFQSSAMSAHWATRHPNDPSFFRLDSRNIPFLRSASKALKELPQLHRYVRPTPYQCAEKRLYPCSTPGTLGPQSKRRRLLVEDETVPNFPHSSHEEYDLMYEDNAMNMDLHSLRVANDLLHPPSYLLTKSEADAATSITQGQRPTILKSRLLRRQPMQRPNFSFLPPIPLDKTMQDVEMMEMDEEEQTVSDLDGDEIFVEIEQQLESSTRPEAEPEQQQHNSSDTESEYMSPVASANASFASFSGCNREQQLESKQQPEQQHEQQQEPSRSFTMAPPTGPQPRSSLSSGFGSFATVQTGSTAGSLQLNAFQPPVCSSKMFESTSRVVSSTYQVKMSERTTICGDIDEPSSLATGWSMPSALGKTVHIGSSADRPMLQMLDTTLGMSSYDMTAMDAMAEQETERVGQREPEPEPVTEPEPEAKPEADAEPEAEPEPELEPELEPEPELEQEPEPEAESIPSRKQASPLAYIDLEDDENEAEVEAEVAAEVEAEAEGDDVEVDEEELEVGHEELAPLQPHESQVDEEDDARDDVEQQEQCTSSSFDQTTIPLSFNRGSPSYSVSSELSDLSSPRTDAPVYSIVVESTNSISDSRSPASHTPNSFLPSDTNVSQNSSPRAHGVGGEGGSNRSLYRANSLETVDDLDTTKGSLEEDDDVDEEDECVIALDGTEVRGYVARAEPVAACNSAELFAFKQQDETEQQANQAPCPSLVATANSDSVMAYTINLDSVDSVEVQPAVATVTSIGGSSNDSVATVAFSEHKDQQDKQDQQQEQEQEPELPMNVDEVEEKAVAPAQSALDVADSIAINLDSDMDSNPSLLVLSDKEEMDVEMKDEGEKNNKPLVETVTVIDTETETKEPDQPLEIQQPIQVDSAEQSIHLDSDKEVDAEEENKSQDISRQVLPRTRGSLRSLSGTPPLQQCRIRLRNENHRRSVSSTRSTPSPSLRSRLRSASSSGTVAEDQLPENDAETSRGTTDSPDPTKYPVTKRRSLRGGSLPPISTVPVSTPKRRRKLLPRPMEVIDETAEAQSSTTPRTRSRRQLGQSTASVPVLVAAEQNVDSKTSHNKLRSNSEPPSPIVVAAPVKGRRRVKPSIEEPLKKDVAPRNLRSRRSTTEADAEQPTTSSSARSTVSDSSVPLKKRGRSKK